MVWDGSSASVIALPVAPSCSRYCPSRASVDTALSVVRRKESVGSGGGIPRPFTPPGAAGGCQRAQRVRRPPLPRPRPPPEGDPRARGKPRAGRPLPVSVPPPPGGPGLPPRDALGPPRTAHEREPGEPVRGAAAAAAVHSLRSRRRRGEAWRTPT